MVISNFLFLITSKILVFDLYISMYSSSIVESDCPSTASIPSEDENVLGVI